MSFTSYKFSIIQNKQFREFLGNIAYIYDYIIPLKFGQPGRVQIKYSYHNKNSRDKNLQEFLQEDREGIFQNKLQKPCLAADAREKTVMQERRKEGNQ